MHLVHGTAAAHRQAIEAEGLREPWQGRGVSLCAPEYVGTALRAARTACAVERHERGGTETRATGLLVHVELAPERVAAEAPAGRADATPTVLASHVPPAAIVRVQEVAVDLPPAGSSADATLRGAGFARSRPSLVARSTLRDVQRLAETTAAREQATTDLARARDDLARSMEPVRASLADLRTAWAEEKRRRGLLP